MNAGVGPGNDDDDDESTPARTFPLQWSDTALAPRSCTPEPPPQPALHMMLMIIIINDQDDYMTLMIMIMIMTITSGQLSSTVLMVMVNKIKHDSYEYED